MSITLHPTKGVNPFLTYCPRCGGEGRDLLLLGTRNRKCTCGHCGTVNFGIGPAGKCGDCKRVMSTSPSSKWRNLHEGERLPGSLCASCEKEVAEHKKAVADGGIHFKCTDCPANGVIKASAPLAKLVREKMGIAPPDPCGVEFSQKDCPVCSESTNDGQKE